MKKIAIASTLSLGLLLAGCSANEKHVVVQTSAGDITQSEYQKTLEDMAKTNAVYELIVEKQLEKKYKATDKEVNDALKQAYEGQGLTSESQLETQLKQNGTTLDSYKHQIKISVLLQKAELDGVKVTDKDLKNEYAKRQKEVKASHILVATKAEAEDVLKRLKAGEDFAKVAKDVSTDTDTASKGGDLDYFQAGAMEIAFENAAFSMKVGEVSDPVQTSYGYHIIKVTGIKKLSNVPAYKDLKSELKTNLEQRLAKTQDEVLQDLLKNSKATAKDDDFKSTVDLLLGKSTTSSSK